MDEGSEINHFGGRRSDRSKELPWWPLFRAAGEEIILPGWTKMQR